METETPATETERRAMVMAMVILATETEPLVMAMVILATETELLVTATETETAIQGVAIQV
jgi:hypothetical protein